jgi:hypothetical protein
MRVTSGSARKKYPTIIYSDKAQIPFNFGLSGSMRDSCEPLEILPLEV